MEGLPLEICLKIFCFLDYQNLATAQQVCKRWKVLASDNNLWSNLFKERWGVDRAAFYAPVGSKSWKDVYEVQDLRSHWTGIEDNKRGRRLLSCSPRQDPTLFGFEEETEERAERSHFDFEERMQWGRIPGRRGVLLPQDFG